jgi:putative IMPACT (imprinted ancient) family translation regulator
MRMSKEAKDKIKKYTEELIWEEKKKQELLNKEIDYSFLQTLINKCNDNQDLVITIYFKSGDRMTLQTKFKNNDYSAGSSYDGEPSINEMDIK